MNEISVRCDYCRKMLSSWKEPHDLMACVDQIKSQRDKVEAVLRWLTALHCGLGKDGNAPYDGEFEDAIEAAQAALDGDG